MTKIRFDRLARLHEIVDGIPSRRFDLDSIALNKFDGPDNDPHHCGTVGCALGWGGMHPEFHKLGLRTSPEGYLLFHGEWVIYSVAAISLFNIGADDARNLFSPVGGSVYDRGIRSTNSKQVFKHRMRQFFIEHGQPVRQD